MMANNIIMLKRHDKRFLYDFIPSGKHVVMAVICE